jgi:hypothetical protein
MRRILSALFLIFLALVCILFGSGLIYARPIQLKIISGVGGSAGIISGPLSIIGITPTGGNFTPGIQNGVVATINVTLSNGGSFSAAGGTLSITGTNSGGFHISGTSLLQSSASGGTAAGTYNDFTIRATLVSAINSPQDQAQSWTTPPPSGGYVSYSASCGTANGDSGSNITVDYSQTCASMPPIGQSVTAEQGLYAGSTETTTMKAMPTAYERTLWGPWCWSVGSNNNNFRCQDTFYGGDQILDSIVLDGAIPIVSLTPGYAVAGAWESMCESIFACSATEFIEVVRQGLVHLASAYPNIRYITDGNEPDFNGWSMAEIVEHHRRVWIAIGQANGQLGSQHFFSGGPDPAFCGSFDFNTYIRDSLAAGTGFDFISYHNYGSATIMGCQGSIQSALAANGLSSHLLQINTESSLQGSELTVHKAAFHYVDAWYGPLANNLNILPTIWDKQEDYLSYESPFVSCSSLCLGPGYNAAKIMGKHRANRVNPSAITGPVSSFHPIATADSRGAAISLGAFGATGTFTVNLNNLPAAFATGTFTWQEFLLDNSHGNYMAGDFNLPMVASGSNGAASSWSHSVTISDADSVLIFVLLPQ